VLEPHARPALVVHHALVGSEERVGALPRQLVEEVVAQVLNGLGLRNVLLAVPSGEYREAKLGTNETVAEPVEVDGGEGGAVL
jgi:hypothetical protein